MTFSTKVKEEIIKSIPADNSLATLCGLILSCGSIVISNKMLSFTLSSENPNILNFAKKIIAKNFPRACPVISKDSARQTLSLDAQSSQEILYECGILERDENGRTNINLVGDNHLIIESEAKISYLVGMFLGAGSISLPNGKTSGFHMEWSFADISQAAKVCEILLCYDVFAKMVQRGDYFVVYLKDSGSIAQVLALLGATSCYLQLESQLVDRQMRNLVNRQSNCISANIDKAVTAGIKQLKAIDIIDSTVGLDSLAPSLQEIAKLRREHPEATLTDMVELLGKKVSKSAVNLRLRKILQIAKELDTNE